MNAFYLFLAVLVPFVGGALNPLIPWKKRRHMLWYLEGLVTLNSVLVWMLLLHRPLEKFTLVNFTGNLAIAFQLDGLGTVFAGLISFLWPLATLYAFEYMTKEKHEKTFFMFYTFTYGVTLGIALADNFLTMYCFYEMLTLVTLPLVMHTLTREAILASRKYLYYSIGGAAFAFIGMIFVITYGETSDFLLGGVMNAAKLSEGRNLFLLIYVFSFFGFGVKAAVCPFKTGTRMHWQVIVGPSAGTITPFSIVPQIRSGSFSLFSSSPPIYGIILPSISGQSANVLPAPEIAW